MMVEMLIQTMIQAMYPGGITEFDRSFSVFVTSDNQLIVASLSDVELEKKFKERLGKLCANNQMSILYADQSNFSVFSDDMSEGEKYLRGVLSESLEKFNGRLQLSANTALLDIIAPGVMKNSDEGEELVEVLSNLEHIPNVRIEFNDGSFLNLRSKELGLSTIQGITKATLVTGRPDRDITINKDDMMNLKIALGSANTVEEFLEMI